MISNSLNARLALIQLYLIDISETLYIKVINVPLNNFLNHVVRSITNDMIYEYELQVSIDMIYFETGETECS